MVSSRLLLLLQPNACPVLFQDISERVISTPMSLMSLFLLLLPLIKVQPIDDISEIKLLQSSSLLLNITPNTMHPLSSLLSPNEYLTFLFLPLLLLQLQKLWAFWLEWAKVWSGKVQNYQPQSPWSLLWVIYLLLLFARLLASVIERLGSVSSSTRSFRLIIITPQSDKALLNQKKNPRSLTFLSLISKLLKLKAKDLNGLKVKWMMKQFLFSILKSGDRGKFRPLLSNKLFENLTIIAILSSLTSNKSRLILWKGWVYSSILKISTSAIYWINILSRLR